MDAALLLGCPGDGRDSDSAQQLHRFLEKDLARVTHALVTGKVNYCTTFFAGQPLITAQLMQTTAAHAFHFYKNAIGSQPIYVSTSSGWLLLPLQIGIRILQELSDLPRTCKPIKILW